MRVLEVNFVDRIKQKEEFIQTIRPKWSKVVWTQREDVWRKGQYNKIQNGSELKE